MSSSTRGFTKWYSKSFLSESKIFCMMTEQRRVTLRVQRRTIISFSLYMTDCTFEIRLVKIFLGLKSKLNECINLVPTVFAGISTTTLSSSTVHWYYYCYCCCSGYCCCTDIVVILGWWSYCCYHCCCFWGHHSHSHCYHWSCYTRSWCYGYCCYCKRFDYSCDHKETPRTRKEGKLSQLALKLLW